MHKKIMYLCAHFLKRLCYSYIIKNKATPDVIRGKEVKNMIKYVVKYCLVSDCRETLRLDAYYDTFTDAVNKSLELETDPDIYTSWVEEDNKNYYND